MTRRVAAQPARPPVRRERRSRSEPFPSSFQWGVATSGFQSEAGGSPATPTGAATGGAWTHDGDELARGARHAPTGSSAVPATGACGGATSTSPTDSAPTSSGWGSSGAASSRARPRGAHDDAGSSTASRTSAPCATTGACCAASAPRHAAVRHAQPLHAADRGSTTRSPRATRWRGAGADDPLPSWREPRGWLDERDGPRVPQVRGVPGAGSSATSSTCGRRSTSRVVVAASGYVNMPRRLGRQLPARGAVLRGRAIAERAHDDPRERRRLRRHQARTTAARASGSCRTSIAFTPPTRPRRPTWPRRATPTSSSTGSSSTPRCAAWSTTTPTAWWTRASGSRPLARQGRLHRRELLLPRPRRRARRAAHAAHPAARLPYSIFYRTPADPDAPACPTTCTEFGTEVYPEGLRQVLATAGSYGLPVYITENGLADADDDHARATTSSRHLRVLRQAMADGVADVRGYLYWSLVDNFEWSDGYAPALRALLVRPANAAAHAAAERGADPPDLPDGPASGLEVLGEDQVRRGARARTCRSARARRRTMSSSSASRIDSVVASSSRSSAASDWSSWTPRTVRPQFVQCSSTTARSWSTRSTMLSGTTNGFWQPAQMWRGSGWSEWRISRHQTPPYPESCGKESGLLRGLVALALRRQALDDPRAAVAAEAQAVVEAVGAALPELDGVGDDAQAAPVRRARDGVPSGASSRGLARARSSSSRDATTDDCGLAAAESCEPRGREAKYASVSASVDRRRSRRSRRTWRSHRQPREDERGARVVGGLAALARRQVGEERRSRGRRRP